MDSFKHFKFKLCHGSIFLSSTSKKIGNEWVYYKFNILLVQGHFNYHNFNHLTSIT